MLYEIDYKNIFFAYGSPKSSASPIEWVKKAIITATKAVISKRILLADPAVPLTTIDPAPLKASATPQLAKKTKLSNRVMVYGDKQATALLAKLVLDFLSIWKDEGFVNLPQDN